MTLKAMASTEFSWASATDASCTALAATHCICIDNTAVAFTTTGNSQSGSNLCALQKDCVPTGKCVCTPGVAGGAKPV